MKRKSLLIIFLIALLGLTAIWVDAFDNIYWNFENSLEYQFDENSIKIEDGIAELVQTDNWFDSQWIYRKKIIITNSNETLNDFQLKFVLNSDNFDFTKALGDGRDIRITQDDGVTILPFWLEEYSAVSSSGIVWFKAPQLVNGENNFYIYYGNPQANILSNGQEVFLSFDDDFNDVGEPLFNAPSFLNTPTYDGEGQAIHPDIYYNEIGWNGWKYWMANTPYTNSDDDVENPSMLVSNNGTDWSVPDGLINPIVDMPEGGGYNSDPDLVYNPSGDYLMYYYRESQSNGNDSIKLVTSTNGVIWSQPVSLTFANDDNAYREISPAIIRQDNGQYKMWYVGDGHGVTGTRSVYYRESNDGINWQDRQLIIINNFDNYSPWHINVRYLPEKQEYFMMISANPIGSTGSNTDLYLATSVDGLNWFGHERPLLLRSANGWDKNQIYRADFLYDSDNNDFRLWYSARSTVSTNVWRTGYIDGDYDYIINNLLSLNLIDVARKASTTAIAINTQVHTIDDQIRLSGAPNQISSGGILLKQNFTNNIILELKHKIDDGYYADVSLGGGDVRSEVVGGTPSWHHTVLQDGYHWMWGGANSPVSSANSAFAIKRFSANLNGQTISSTALPSLSTLNQWHKLKYVYTSTGILMVYHDDILWQTATDTTFLNTDKKFLISQGEYSNGRGGNRDIDYLFVRQYAQFEPTTVLINEESQYNLNYPVIRTIGSGPDYTALSGLSAEIVSSNGGQIKFQISNDGQIFYWWDGNDWVEADDEVLESNTVSEINDNITDFPAGNFNWRAYFISDGRQDVQLESVGLIYINDLEAPSGSLVINEGNSYVATSTVALEIEVNDNIDATSTIAMQISNSDNFSEAIWVDYSSSMNWVLSADQGVNFVYIRFKDSTGNISESISASIIFDDQSPSIESLLIDSLIDRADFVINSDESIGNLTINYGVSNNYGATSSLLINNQSASLTINNLLSCLKYYYQIEFSDLAGNLSPLITGTFNTGGCLGEANVVSEQDVLIDNSGGQINSGDPDSGVNLTFPVNLIGSGFIVQLKEINRAVANQSTILPNNFVSWTGNWYKIDALNYDGTRINSFDNPVVVTINYNNSQIDGLDVDTLAIFRYSGGVWSQLDNCQNNSEAASISCETNNFSTLALLGNPLSTGSIDNSTNVSAGSSLPVTALIKPVINSQDITITNGYYDNDFWQVSDSIVKINIAVINNIKGVALSNDNNFLIASWQKYQPEINWSICQDSNCNQISNNIYIRFYNEYGLSSDSHRLKIHYVAKEQNLESNSDDVNYKIIRNLDKERAAIPVFVMVERRLPTTATDWQSFHDLVYGDQKWKANRNLNQEKLFINWFIRRYKKLPTTSIDWQLINWLAYK